MNGQVLDFSIQTNSGIILGDDGNRYDFAGAEWKETDNPSRGMRVEFTAEGGSSVAVRRALETVPPAAGPDHIRRPWFRLTPRRGFLLIMVLQVVGFFWLAAVSNENEDGFGVHLIPPIILIGAAVAILLVLVVVFWVNLLFRVLTGKNLSDIGGPAFLAAFFTAFGAGGGEGGGDGGGDGGGGA